MSEKQKRLKFSALFGLKVGGSLGLVLALICDFFLPLAPIGLWLFWIAFTVFLITGMVRALQPTEAAPEQKGLWFAPFAMVLLTFAVVNLTSFIISESACEEGCGYLAANIPALKSLQIEMGLLEL